MCATWRLTLGKELSALGWILLYGLGYLLMFMVAGMTFVATVAVAVKLAWVLAAG